MPYNIIKQFSPIYSGECSLELAYHYCKPCPDQEDREAGRVRSSGFIFSDYYETVMENPEDTTVWEEGITAGKIIVVPETSGEYDPGEPKALKGYADRLETYGARTMTLKFNDPNLAENYPHYNGLVNQTELIPFFRTSSALRIFDKPASIIARDPVADDMESEVIWEVTAKVSSINLPTYHKAASLMKTVFNCAYLNSITGLEETFDTMLTFEAATTDTDLGVLGTVTAINAVTKFEFTGQTGTSGLPKSMSIKKGGVEQMTVDYPAEYNGRAFKFTDTSGVVHNGVFTDPEVLFP